MPLKLFYDVETTGLDHRKHSIHQLSGIVEMDGLILEEFNIHMAPHPKAKIDPVALKHSKVTEEDIRAYPSWEEGYKEFKYLIRGYVDPYKKERFFLVGYNNRKFDDFFLNTLFELGGDKDLFPAYFHTQGIDVMVLAIQHLLDVRKDMPSFKLKRVALQLGIEVDETQLHDSSYDVDLTYKIYQKLTE